jgi:transposase
MPARSFRSTRPCLRITATEREQLLTWIRTRTSPHRLVVRSRIVLLAADGVAPGQIARRVHVAPATVRLWCRRFAEGGVAALGRDKPGRGRRPGMSLRTALAVLRSMQQPAPHGGTWSARTLARHARTSASTVWRVWQRTGIGPDAPAENLRRAIAQLISETGAAAG